MSANQLTMICTELVAILLGSCCRNERLPTNLFARTPGLHSAVLTWWPTPLISVSVSKKEAYKAHRRRTVTTTTPRRISSNSTVATLGIWRMVLVLACWQTQMCEDEKWRVLGSSSRVASRQRNDTRLNPNEENCVDFRRNLLCEMCCTACACSF